MAPGRWLSRLTVAVLLLDAFLLVVASVAGGRTVLLAVSPGLIAVAGGVMLLARRQRDRSTEVDASRREAQDEARILAELLRRTRSGS
jgi:cytochrome c-type biogenesis protein CcmH/NrfF